MSVEELSHVRREAQEMRERARFQRRRAAATVQRAGEQRASVVDTWLRAGARPFELVPGREAAMELRELLRSLAANADLLTSPKYWAAARVAFHALRRYELGLAGGALSARIADPAGVGEGVSGVES